MRVASVDDVEPGDVIKVYVDDEPVALANVGGDFFAVSDTCSHEYVMLSEGWLDDYDIECPQHGSKFDVRTGAVDGPPATQPVDAFETKVENNEVFVGKLKTRSKDV